VKRLSIILPAYNVQQYLSKCIESLLTQDILISDYEIIIVNDGSDDHTLDVVKSYLIKYQDLVILFNQENKGIGAARNVGIRESKGKYLFFVDSDDFVQSDCLSELLDCIEKENLDILRFNYNAIHENGALIPKKRNGLYSTVYSNNIVDGETFLTDYLGWACYPWSFLFRASFIKENFLFFDDSIYFEDVEWLVRVLPLAKRVRSLNKQVYLYLQRSGSITQSIQLEKKNKVVSDKLYVIGKLKQISITTLNKKISLWCGGMTSLIFMGILAYVENELPVRKNEVIELLYDQKYLPLKSYRFTLKQKRDLFIINFSPLIYCFLKRKKNHLICLDRFIHENFPDWFISIREKISKRRS